MMDNFLTDGYLEDEEDAIIIKEEVDLEMDVWTPPEIGNNESTSCHTHSSVPPPPLMNNNPAAEDESRKRYKCVFCGERFYTPTYLDRHRVKYHLGMCPNTTCPLCLLSFRTRMELGKHKREVHQRPRPNVCEHCGKVLSTNRLLKGHIAAFHGGSRHQCGLCDKSYSQKYSLTIHMRISHSDNVTNLK